MQPFVWRSSCQLGILFAHPVSSTYNTYQRVVSSLSVKTFWRFWRHSFAHHQQMLTASSCFSRASNHWPYSSSTEINSMPMNQLDARALHIWRKEWRPKSLGGAYFFPLFYIYTEHWSLDVLSSFAAAVDSHINNLQLRRGTTLVKDYPLADSVYQWHLYGQHVTRNLCYPCCTVTETMVYSILPWHTCLCFHCV